MNQNGNGEKTAYICGPLTELTAAQQRKIKMFYERIADTYQEATGVRAFVPHEHYDPIRHSDFLPTEVDAAERRQVCQLTTVLVVVAVAPSWGGGIEVEMANGSGVPVIIIREKEKRISRLLLGNPAVVEVIQYASESEALALLQDRFSAFVQKA